MAVWLGVPLVRICNTDKHPLPANILRSGRTELYTNWCIFHHELWATQCEKKTKQPAALIGCINCCSLVSCMRNGACGPFYVYQLIGWSRKRDLRPTESVKSSSDSMLHANDGLIIAAQLIFFRVCISGGGGKSNCRLKFP